MCPALPPALAALTYLHPDIRTSVELDALCSPERNFLGGADVLISRSLGVRIESAEEAK